MIKRIINICTLLAAACLLTACSNPALNGSPDTLAKAINGFDKDNMSIERPAECGNFLADPEKAQTYFLIEMNLAAYQKGCKDYATRLAAYLDTQPGFKGMTADNMRDKATWQYYFQSRHAIGKVN